MNIESFRDYCLTKKGAAESLPFPTHPNILVFKVMGKMFTATDLETFERFSIKCDPSTIESLREEYDALREPVYFSKKHWSEVIVDRSIPDTLLLKWIDISYDLVVKGLTRKARKELEELE